MAFRTVQPMFGTGTIFTPKSNFFVDYLYARVKLTNQKNRELMQAELADVSQQSRQLKDEEVRIRQQIATLQKSLLDREQAWLSRSFASERQRSSQQQASNIAANRERNKYDTDKERSMTAARNAWNTGQNQMSAASQKFGAKDQSFKNNLANAIRTAGGPNQYFETANAIGQSDMARLYNVTNEDMDPTSPQRGLFGFMKMYEHVRDEYGVEAAASFKKAVFESNTATKDKPELLAMPVLMDEGSPNEPSLVEQNFFYDETYLTQTVLPEIDADFEAKKASVPEGGGSSTIRRSTTTPSDSTSFDVGGTQVDETKTLIQEYKTRLQEITDARKKLEGRQSEVIERRLGQKSFAEQLTPFTRTDPEVDNLIDSILGITDEDIRNQALAGTRMLVQSERERIVPEYVEENLLDPSMLRRYFNSTEKYIGDIARYRASADAHFVSVSRRAKELGNVQERMDQARAEYERAQQDPDATPEVIEAARQQFEGLARTVDRNRMEYETLLTTMNEADRVAAYYEEQEQLFGAVYDELKKLVEHPRGPSAGWSEMSGQERMLLTSAMNARSLNIAERHGNEAEKIRENIERLEYDVRTLEQDENIGARGSRLFQENISAVETLQELEREKAKLQEALAKQNNSLMAAARSQDAVNHLLENDPDYLISEDPRQGLGPAEPVRADTLSPEEEEAMLERRGDEGQRRGQERGERNVEREARRTREAEQRAQGLGGSVMSILDAREQQDFLGLQSDALRKQLDEISDPQTASDPDKVRRIQENINDVRRRQGQDPIEVDGVLGPDTQQGMQQLRDSIESKISAYEGASQSLEQEIAGTQGFIDSEREMQIREPEGDGEAEDVPDFDTPEEVEEFIDQLGRLAIPDPVVGAQGPGPGGELTRQDVDKPRQLAQETQENEPETVVAPTFDEVPASEIEVSEPEDEVVFQAPNVDQIEEVPASTVIGSQAAGTTAPVSRVFKPEDQAFLDSLDLSSLIEEIPQAMRDHPSLVVEPLRRLTDPSVRKSFFYDLGPILSDLISDQENYPGEREMLTNTVNARLQRAYELQRMVDSGQSVR